MKRKRTTKTGKQYGQINRNIFNLVKTSPHISRAQLKALKNRKKLAKAAQFGIQIYFDPQVFLSNPMEEVKQYLAAFLGVNMSLAIRDRIVIDERGPDNKVMGPFFNTGGMWQGYDPRRKGTDKVDTQFFKSSYSAGFLIAEMRKAGQKRQPGLSISQLKKLARERKKASLKGTDVVGIGKVKGYEVNVRNRDKARSALESTKVAGAARGRELLEPTKGEQDAIFGYLHDLLALRTMIGDVSNVRPKLRKARARRLVQALGKIKAPQLSIN